MKVPLILDILKEIVEDGVKEMKSRMNFTKRQRVMKCKVMDKVHKYRDLLVSEYLPVLVFDFDNAVEVQISCGRMDEDKGTKLKYFMNLVKKSDDRQYLICLLDEVREILQNDDQDVRVSHLLEERHDWIMRRLEEYIKKEILDNVHRHTVEKCELESAIFNFTDEELSEDIKKMFKSGVDSSIDANEE